MEFETSRRLDAFKDILVDRYGTSDFLWMSQKWHPTPAYSLVNKTNPRKIKIDVLNSPCVQYALQQACEEKNVPKEQMYKMVESILDEIGYNRQLSVIRWFGIALLKVMKKTCNGLYVNEVSIKRIMSSLGPNPVIFAPSHRSYGDFILMSYICFHYQIQIPVIAAGMDFHSMWLMGRLLRDTGAFFMRRSFGNDKLYWTVFSEYVHKLVTDGDAAIEFFIEGTRSRSAKSLPPKFGFLSMTLVPFLMGRVPDITIVPINISYDRTLEEVLFAYELLGVPKPKETTSGFLKALNMLNERYGKVHMDFAEPLSVRDMMLSNGLRRRLPTPASPQVQPTLSTDETAFCVEVAHRVVQQQQRHSVLSAFNLMAIMLNQSVLERTGPPLLRDVLANVSWFKNVMEVVGALIDIPGTPGAVDAAVREAISIHKSLVTLTPSDHLKLVKVHTSGRVVDPAKLKGHSLSYQTMDVAVPMVMLQHYVNPCLHYLVGPAMVTLILRHLEDTVEISREELFNKFSFLRTLFLYEFALYGPWAEKDFTDSLKQLEALSVIETTKSGAVKLGNHMKLQSVLANLLQPFLHGYQALCEVLSQCVTTAWSEKQVIKATQQRVEELLTSCVITHPYSLVLDMHSSALQSLTSLSIVSRIKRNGQVEYLSHAGKLQDVTQKLENLILPAAEKFHDSEANTKHFVIHGTQQAKL